MEWTQKEISAIGLVLWVALWAVCKWHSYKVEKRVKDAPNRVDNFSEHDRQLIKWTYISFAAGHYGFIISILWILMMINVLSEVYVFKGSTYRNQESYKVYVPFYYHGHLCKPATSYVSNETNEELTVYAVNYYNGSFCGEPWGEKAIGIGELCRIDGKLETMHPHEYYVSGKKKDNKVKTEWYVDETWLAHEYMDKVRKPVDQNKIETDWDSLKQAKTDSIRKMLDDIVKNAASGNNSK